MRFCVNHPDRAAKWPCQRLEVAYCDDCCRCPLPEGYCKFRRECTVNQACEEAATTEHTEGAEDSVPG